MVFPHQHPTLCPSSRLIRSNTPSAMISIHSTPVIYQMRYYGFLSSPPMKVYFSFYKWRPRMQCDLKCMFMHHSTFHHPRINPTQDGSKQEKIFWFTCRKSVVLSGCSGFLHHLWTAASICTCKSKNLDWSIIITIPLFFKSTYLLKKGRELLVKILKF